MMTSDDRRAAIGPSGTLGGPGWLVLAPVLLVLLGSGSSLSAGEAQGRADEPPALDPDRPFLAQFQLPPATGEGEAPALPKRLTYQYAYGTESEFIWRINPDFDNSLSDNFIHALPQVQGIITYRPTDWLEGTAEVQFEQEIPVQQTETVTLPNGELQFARNPRTNLLIDQAYVTLKGVTGPFEFTVGRRNFEDDRHTLYDTSIDVAMVTFKPTGAVRVEASVGRENLLDWNLLEDEPRDRNDTYMLYSEYRGIEGLKLATYTIHRDDQKRQEGKPVLVGVRALGNPTNWINYWGEFAVVRGEDENRRDLAGHAFDVGATYRFVDLPFQPSLRLGYAFGSGDDPDDRDNNEFRQTGLQSNEARFGGVTDTKVYGEALDAELSNLHVVTAGLGFRPAADTYVDLVYHYYRLDEFADELRNSAITAELNPDAINPSKEVGHGLDVVLGLRNLFGVRGLGVDLRSGLLFPGKAFRRNEGDEDDPLLRDPDLGFSLTAKVLF
jgi:alginate production protein